MNHTEHVENLKEIEGNYLASKSSSIAMERLYTCVIRESVLYGSY